MRLLISAFALVVAMPLLASEPPPTPTITKSDVRRGTPARANVRLRDVIWSMFEPGDQRNARRPRRALNSVWLPTRPRETEVPGLCRSDSAWIEFAPTDRADLGADTPVQAAGITAHRRFRFIRPPADDYHELSDFDRLRSEGACARLSGRDDAFFRSENEEVATDGYRALLLLQQAALGGSVVLECDVFPDETRPCRELIASIGQDAIDQIQRCQSDSGQLCYRIGAGERQIDVFVTASVSPGPPPGQVIRARLSDLIILYHELID